MNTKRLIDSPPVAWCGMLLTAVLVVLTVLLRTPWWCMTGEFFLFMAAFAHLAAIYIKRMSAAAARKLNICAAVCLALSIIGLVAVWIVSNAQAGL